MKTITAQQAANEFDEYSGRAHKGERILLTRDGQPWVVLSPPAVPLKDAPDQVRLNMARFRRAVDAA